MEALVRDDHVVPGVPRTPEDLGVPTSLIAEIALKALYFRGTMRGQDLADYLCIPFSLFEPALMTLNEAAYVQSGGMSRDPRHTALSIMAAVEWQLTRAGQHRAHEVMALSQYSGPIPVTIEDYTAVVAAQTARPRIDEQALRDALDDLVLADEVIEGLGAALNGDHPLFLYGAPGNGKSSIADRLPALLGPPIFVPRAIYADGEIIRFFSPAHHRPIETALVREHDRRWVLVERPAVKVGGELAPHSLELSFDRGLGFYEASAQLKANGGLFLVDDFGRQTRIPPNELLNRLIVPLGSGVDYLNVSRSATTVAVPFTARLVLATNLSPGDLMDEAFLRRIRVKIHVGEPSENRYREIWRRACQREGILLRPEVLDHLIARHYRQTRRAYRGVHPNDILSQVVSLARFRGVEPELTPEMLDMACTTYFIDA